MYFFPEKRKKKRNSSLERDESVIGEWTLPIMVRHCVMGLIVICRMIPMTTAVFRYHVMVEMTLNIHVLMKDMAARQIVQLLRRTRSQLFFPSLLS